MVKIYLISSPSITSKHETFLAERGLTWNRPEPLTPAELIIEFSGRLCYMSFGEGKQSPRDNREYISNLISQGHESVLEHASWSFIISGVTRNFTHQLVRHRVGFSYSQLSQQYYDHSDTEFIVPEGLENSPDALEIWRNSVDQSKIAYRAIINHIEALPDASKKEQLRAVRSAARTLLPGATETSIVVTANARALRHFLNVRGSIVGDIEMRVVSTRLLEILKAQAPAIFADFYIEKMSDGYPIVFKN